MSEIVIPPEALEAGVRAAIALDSGPEGSKLFEIHYAEFAEGYRASIRAACLAMLEAWPGAYEEYMNDEDGDGASVCVILPKGGQR